MTWYYERDGANNRIQLRFEDTQGQTLGPFNVSWPDAPRLTRRGDGFPVNPPCHIGAVKEAKTEAANGNSGRAIEMLADITAGDIRKGAP